MPIPRLNENGFLPEGVHDCTLPEIKAQFGSFQGTSRRPDLFNRLEVFHAEAKTTGIIESIIVDGSFVTSQPRPNDIDLILELRQGFAFSSELTPAEYNVISKTRIRRRFGFDLLVARSASTELARWTEFFQQVRLEPGHKKGILRLPL